MTRTHINNIFIAHIILSRLHPSLVASPNTKDLFAQLLLFFRNFYISGRGIVDVTIIDTLSLMLNCIDRFLGMCTHIQHLGTVEGGRGGYKEGVYSQGRRGSTRALEICHGQQIFY